MPSRGDRGPFDGSRRRSAKSYSEELAMSLRTACLSLALLFCLSSLAAADSPKKLDKFTERSSA